MNISTVLGFIVGILIVNTISMFFQLNVINRKVEKIESHLFKNTISHVNFYNENNWEQHKK